jgi:hypothetical protein
VNQCTICREPTVSDERLEIGKSHCMDPACIAEWRRRRIEGKYALVFVHKQGLMWVPIDEVSKNDMKRQGGA